MLKSKFAKLNELGSLMVEAMAMLALISMVTPILYRKAAERTTELQDINAAGQMRSLIKAVDDYVSDNYNTIVAGNAVNNSVNNSVNYSDLVSGGKKTIDIKHFRDYLPYGFLDSSGNVQDTKTFSKDYKVVFKYTNAGGRKAVTAFVVAEPKEKGNFPMLRASRIASMVGTNGGYAQVSGGKVTVNGVQGIWAIDNMSSELGVTTTNGSIVTSSVQPITEAGGGGNNENYLYRIDMSGNPSTAKLNQMEANLKLGADSGTHHNISNINQLIISAQNQANFSDKSSGNDGALLIKGSGGEGKSQIGAVLGTLFGSNMKDGSIGKISENRFARADLEHILLCVDDDMRMEALRQTNYVKSIVTAQGKMDLERKGKQSYQGWMCARLLAFSNGDLQALFDRSDGFYRRQLVLTTKEKPAGRVDDPDLAEKMKAEVEGILLWAFEGLQRLAANNFKFTESERTRGNREAVKRDNNNVYDFLDSDGYVRLKADLSASSKELYEAYQIYCTENNLPALKPRSFSEALIACQSRYNLEYCNNVTNAAGRRVRGFLGIAVLVRNHISVFSGDSMRTYVPEDVPEEWRR